MSYGLNSLKRGYIGECIGEYVGVFEGDTWSLDYGSFGIRKYWDPMDMRSILIVGELVALNAEL